MTNNIFLVNNTKRPIVEELYRPLVLAKEPHSVHDRSEALYGERNNSELRARINTHYAGNAEMQ